MGELKRLIERDSPPKIVAVGDAVSRNMVKHGVIPHVFIVDNKIMREAIAPIPIEAEVILYTQNPPGTLTDEAWSAVQEALRHPQRVKVLVEGEEDLLTLAAVLCAPEGSFVVYGQPREGIVVVRVTKHKREIFHRIVDAMIPSKS